MPFDISEWVRLESGATPIYVRPHGPDWFVPTSAGDAALRALHQGSPSVPDAGIARFLLRLPGGDVPEYRGRAEHLRCQRLEEFWLHVTDRCNLACAHCLFSCGQGGAGAELPLERALDLARQAHAAGCRVFALTGGEPMLHRRFVSLVDGLLAMEDSHVVVLTNGTLIGDHAERIAAWPGDRVHLQLSVDGPESLHDSVRGPGALAALSRQASWLADRGVAYTLSMSVGAKACERMPEAVALAARWGASNLHYMWYFLQGRARRSRYPDMDRLFGALTSSAAEAESLGVTIDNVEAMKSQVFSPPGTRHDGSMAAWGALAVSARGRLYPSAALLGADELAVEVDGDLGKAWRDAEAFGRIRRATVAEDDSPLRFLTGGGDVDHSYAASGAAIGGDPYLPVLERLALWLIAREAREAPDLPLPALRLKMGEVLRSCGSGGPVALTRSNCLLSVADDQGLRDIREFYTRAARTTNEDILNPVSYALEHVEHIPERFRFRGYGCGSPVLDAEPSAGETVVDLGCGAGVECFIAARRVGPEGRVIGVDMLEDMLSGARAGARAVADRLGYDNLSFVQGRLEDLPLEDASADVIVSNCVLNLSLHKRKLLAEIARVLRPGGRLVVSDVVCEARPPAWIAADASLRGECIAGAMVQHDLLALLGESGLVDARVIRRVPYRTVGGQAFYSLTFSARRAGSWPGRLVRAMYRGPHAAVLARSGRLLPVGRVVTLDASDLPADVEDVLVLDEAGVVTNVAMGASCCCAAPEGGWGDPHGRGAAGGGEASGPQGPVLTAGTPDERFRDGCRVCGLPLAYRPAGVEVRCVDCGQAGTSEMICPEGHYVCDACHRADALEVIRRTCERTDETDMLALFDRLHAHRSVSAHGPEHHSMVPAVMVATYRNLAGRVEEGMLATAIHRGARSIGGAGGYLGVCGAATGVGVGFAVLLGATPVRAALRSRCQAAAAEALGRIASMPAARCCLRDGYVALRVAAERSAELLERPLQADAAIRCRQARSNPQCLGAGCPLQAVHPEPGDAGGETLRQR